MDSQPTTDSQPALTPTQQSIVETKATASDGQSLTPTQQVIGIFLTLFFFPFARHRVFIPKLGEVKSILIIDLIWGFWVFLISLTYANSNLSINAYIYLLNPVAIAFCICFIRDLICICINKF